VLAYFIDTSIFFSVWFATGIILFLLDIEMNSPLINIFSLVINWIYFSVLESSSWQASIGKKALGLKVVDKNGDRISFGRATGRHFS